MNIKFWNQPKDITLGEILNEKLKKGFDKVCLVAGMTKDTGVDVIYDSLMQARNLGSEVDILLGIDRKNTSKDMLMKLLDIGCNLSVHINRDDNKVETRIYIFESKTGDSYVYISNGKFSDGGLLNNYCLIQEITYSSEDKKAFENFKTVLKSENTNIFKEINAEEVKLLAEKGEIVARIIDRKIPSISEMFGNSLSQETVNDDIYDENSSPKIFDIVEDDVDVDVDIDFDGEMKKSELSVEKEARKEKEKEEIIEKEANEKLAKLYKSEEIVQDKKVQIIKDADAIDFKNAKIFVFEVNKIIEKGSGEGEIKVPHSLYENLKEFFGESSKSFQDDKGKNRLGNVVKANIIDVMNNEHYCDDTVYMYDTDKYFAIKSLVLKDLILDEGDIIRLIKQNDNEFVIEVIRKNTKEYEIWESFCKYTMRNTKRRYGIM